MTKISILILSGILISSPSFAQEKQKGIQGVIQNNEAPNLKDTSWKFVGTNIVDFDRYIMDQENNATVLFRIQLHVDIYENENEKIQAGVYWLSYNKDARADFLMLYGDSRIKRWAIQVDDEWFPATEVANKENPLSSPQIKMVQADVDLGMEATYQMETVDGIKQWTLKIQ